MTGQASAADLYALLGVPSDADAAAIKAAYRRRARALHPDRNPDDPDADEKFSAVREAFEVLSSTSRRSEYDQRRRQPRPPPVARPAPAAAPRPPYQPPPPSPVDRPSVGHPVAGRRLTFDVAVRPPSTPDLSALDRWSRGLGTATAAAVVAAALLGRRGAGTVSTVGVVLLALAVVALLVLLLVRTSRPRRGRLHLVVGPGSLTFPARQGWHWFGPAVWQVAVVGVLGAWLANVDSTALALFRVDPWNVLVLMAFGALLFRHALSGSAWSLLRRQVRGRPPELTITAEGVSYIKGSTYWSCRWGELIEIGTPTLAGATRLTTVRSRVRLGAHHLDSDVALVLQILAFYAANLQARHEIGTSAVTRLLRGDFDTPA